jgi:hypothetical protein
MTSSARSYLPCQATLQSQFNTFSNNVARAILKKKSLDQDAIRELKKVVLETERKNLRKIFDGDTFHSEFKD